MRPATPAKLSLPVSKREFVPTLRAFLTLMLLAAPLGAQQKLPAGEIRARAEKLVGDGPPLVWRCSPVVPDEILVGGLGAHRVDYRHRMKSCLRSKD